MEFDYFRAGDNRLIRYAMVSGVNDKTRGCLLLLNGRSEFMEKYEPTVARLTARGFHVVSLDWRGQGLSVRELERRDKGYVRSFQCYLDDLDLFFTQFVRPLALPVTLLAHSMGGHIALRFMARQGVEIERAVLISPMVDIVTSPIPRPLAEVLARQMVKWGGEACYIPGNRDYDRDAVRFAGNRLSHDPHGFWREHRCIEKNRDLALGGVTWGWLNAAFDSIRILGAGDLARRISPPVLLMSAAEDRVVSCAAQKKICRRLSRGTFLSVPRSGHEILSETDEVLTFFWNAFDKFTAGKK